MGKILDYFVLTPKDVGIEKYSLEEIIKEMKPGDDDIDNSSLYEFARLVTHTLEVDSCHEKAKDAA